MCGTPFIAERKLTILPGMSYPFADIAFTPAVQKLQERYGSRAKLAQMQARGARGEALGPQEADFLARADSFYLATVGETGWPYVQHRGGPPGFFRCSRRCSSPSPTSAATCSTSAPATPRATRAPRSS